LSARASAALCAGAPGRPAQGGWLDIGSVIVYSHHVPEYRRQLVAAIDEAAMPQRR
jgi:hypothetical protein